MPEPLTGRILVVDDTLIGRVSLAREVLSAGHSVEMATSGKEALTKLATESFDVVLLDMVMPDLTGEEVLAHLKQDLSLRAIPVVMVSSEDEFKTVVRCIEQGADDYLPKPPNPVLLHARLRALIERKRLRDREQQRALELQVAVDEAERLLLNILPHSVATELKSTGQFTPRNIVDCTIVFTDFVHFSRTSSQIAPQQLVSKLNHYFTAFDRICDARGMEKIKTLGDSYMYAAGLPVPRASHAVDAVLTALEMLDFVRTTAEADPSVAWQMRVGVHSGPVTAGVVGIKKFCFDVWGDTVNLASRMQSSGVPNSLNISEETLNQVRDFFTVEPRGAIQIKGEEQRPMYLVNGPVQWFGTIYRERFGDRAV